MNETTPMANEPITWELLLKRLVDGRFNSLAVMYAIIECKTLILACRVVNDNRLRCLFKMQMALYKFNGCDTDDLDAADSYLTTIDTKYKKVLDAEDKALQAMPRIAASLRAIGHMPKTCSITIKKAVSNAESHIDDGKTLENELRLCGLICDLADILDTEEAQHKAKNQASLTAKNEDLIRENKALKEEIATLKESCKKTEINPLRSNPLM